MVKTLGVNGPYIIYNGAKIVDGRGKEIYSDAIPIKKLTHFLEKLNAIGASIIFSHRGQVFCLKRAERVVVYERKELIYCHIEDNRILDSELVVNKILIIGDVENYKKYWNKLSKSLRNEFRYVISEDTYMEIIKKDVSKGSALRS